MPEVDDAEAIGVEAHVAVQVAEEAIVDYTPRPRSPEVRRPRKTDDDLLAEFWADAGFPSPSSRTLALLGTALHAGIGAVRYGC
jgi:hypothetical protein